MKDVSLKWIVISDREDYRYSGSENEEEEPAIAGEPSSIVQAPGDNTLRRNFQQIQESRTLTQQDEKQDGKKYRKGDREEIPEPGPPSRPSLPQRLIGNEHIPLCKYHCFTE